MTRMAVELQNDAHELNITKREAKVTIETFHQFSDIPFHLRDINFQKYYTIRRFV